MRGSLIIIACFAAGLVCGRLTSLDELFSGLDAETRVLWLLLFLVGVTVGADKRAFSILRDKSFGILLVPVVSVLGSVMGFLGAAGLLTTVDARQGLAAACGMGYYSLTSVLLGQMSGEAAGMVALIANILREAMTLLATPLLVRWFGPLSAIAAGGATAMDTTLPVIARFSGREYAAVAVASGVILTMLVPFLVTFIAG